MKGKGIQKAIVRLEDQRMIHTIKAYNEVFSLQLDLIL